jgi:hypothetical protein
MFARQATWLALASVALGLSSSGCQTDAYCFLCDPALPTDGGHRPAAGNNDSGPRFQLPPPDSGSGAGDSGAGGKSGCAADKETDPNNCGACGNVCSIPGAFTKCVAGACQFDRCAPGLVDANKKPADGCECTTTNGGTELCDQIDNNCDGKTDEGFDLATSVQNCGACNTACPDLPHASVACAAGKCAYTCETGFDNLAQVGVGCPYQCPVFPKKAEVCNGIDEDCDGIIDNGDPGAGDPCDDQCPVDSTGKHKCVGACTSGRTVCTGTTAGVACVGGTQPTGEICDDLDNDCNGTTDEGYDKTTDALNCGGCGIQCQAGIVCVAGFCQFTCAPNQLDLDKNPANGCEYTCPIAPTNPPTPETCNGVDDNCDGLVDNSPIDVGTPCTGTCPAPDPCVAAGTCAPYAVSPENAANNGCYGVCAANGITACPAGIPVCQYAKQTVNELCNGLDDNCDGRVDEGFGFTQDPLNCGACGNVCTEPNALVVTCAAGVCSSVVACAPGYQDNNNVPTDGCEYRCPVFPPVGESCNGVDDNCDGLTDNAPSGSGQSCAADCPAAAPCIAAGTCTLGVSARTNGCYGVCASDGRTACATGTSTCTHPGKTAETCDGLDDDCDGLIDNGFDLLTDVQNCGSCGFVCALPGAGTQACVAGACRSTACTAGFADLDQNPLNGCEYACPVFPVKAETCNNTDDDCNGTIDDSPTDAGKLCAGSCPAPDPCVTAGSCSPAVTVQSDGCYGVCRNGGVGVCFAGAIACRYSTVQSSEICNDLDDNCNGLTDEAFNKQTDAANCGSCGNVCAATNATARACTAGVCGAVTACTLGFRDVNGNPADGCEYACPVFPTVAEQCNGKDDDCNGVTDDNPIGLGQSCTSNCPAPNPCVAAGTCTGTVSTNTNGCFGVCASDGRTTCPAGGAIVCAHTVAGTETCNGLDDDCDGVIDNGFNLLTDVQNCGSCGFVCALPGASAQSCIAGICRSTACTGGFADIDKNPLNGCEYACPVFPVKAETCNNTDDDCNGAIDDSPTDAGKSCVGSCPAPDPCVTAGSCSPAVTVQGDGCYGVCRNGGVGVCLAGAIACRYSTVQSNEICNDLDDNCDGRTDETFNKQTDAFNCGTCGTVCSATNATARACTAGACGAVTACTPGFRDVNGNPADGCEYTCPVYPPIAEQCNGKDDDCNALTDDNVVGMGQACTNNCPAPDPCIAANSCTLGISGQTNGCHGVCASDGRTTCPAGGVVVCAHPAAGTEACNGLDDDCDGLIDDGFNLLTDVQNCGSCSFVCALPGASAQSCVAGACRSTACAAGFADIDKNTLNGCEYACPVFPTKAETCNNTDDDCNGAIDDSPTDAGQPCSGGCPAPNACVTAGTCSPPVTVQGNGCYGVCRNGGLSVCTAGALGCKYSTVQSNEVCNNLDDNCDGRTDEGFDKQNDPGNCGSCANVCAATNATARACTAGVCGAVTACTPGYRDVNGLPGDGCEYACPVYPPTSEQCNNKDDDCNALTDDNVVGLGQACAANCPPPNGCVIANNCTVAVSGNTSGCYGVCASDGRTTCPAGGAIVCAHSSLGAEACNGLDDNCDGRIDEGFNKQTDASNCGSCGNVCALPGAATVQCVAGACAVLTCVPGQANVDGSQLNGCEYACPVFPTKAETCNGIDDDCDGVVDNAPTDVGTPCADNCPGGTSCVGICTTGSLACITGKKVCQGGGGVKLEVCNNLDDDCNGTTDNGFNTLIDPLNCGGCTTTTPLVNHKCALLNVGVNGCIGGNCSITSCAPGFANIDGLASTGCEYTCPVFPPQAETCNGKDDDCDGLTDAADPGLVVPANFCVQTGPCAGSTPQCQGGSGWLCNYSADIDVTSGAVAFAEARCDGKDNNCNGQTDETFALKGQGCTNGKGVCAGSALYTCKPDLSGTECLAPITPTNAIDEDCNGTDDNCDGGTDERAPVAGSLCYNPSKTVADVHACAGWVDPMVQLVDKVTAGPGAAASITAFAGGVATITGLAGITAANIGQFITVSGANTAGNNGRFPILTAPSATSVTYTNATGATGDTKNGTIAWTVGILPLTAPVWVYSYEASRTDAKPNATGIAAGRACSKGNKIPWSTVKATEAAAACAAVKNSAGNPMRLCTENEWQAACEATVGPANTTPNPWGMTPLWSYSTAPGTYVSGECNDNGSGAGGPWATGKTAAGADNTCYANWGGLNRIYDMSGNLSEWTSSTAVSGGTTYQRVRGGNYQTFPQGTRCDFNFVLDLPTFQNFDLGFRCCSSAAP